MSQPLEYARGEPFSRSAIGTLVIGVTSGPLAVAIAFVFSNVAGLLFFAATLFVAGVVCWVRRFQIERSASSTARLVATIGALFPIAYAFLAFTLLCASVQE